MKFKYSFQILYIAPEDDISLLRAFFDDREVDITEASTLGDALETAQILEFDLFLLETRFPDGSGYDLCRWLRQRFPQALIVFYSADARDVDQLQGLRAGADTYLVKPHFDTLVSVIDNFMNQEKSPNYAFHQLPDVLVM